MCVQYTSYQVSLEFLAMITITIHRVIIIRKLSVECDNNSVSIAARRGGVNSHLFEFLNLKVLRELLYERR